MTENTTQERIKDTPITREQFVEAKAGNYLKLEADKDYIVGFESANYCLHEYTAGEGQKPTLALIIDHLDGVELEESQEFTTSSKALASMVEEYRLNEACNLFKWLFKIRRTGEKIMTKYSLTPIKPRQIAQNAPGGSQSHLSPPIPIMGIPKV